MSELTVRSNVQRLDEVEEALMLFMAIMTGEPADATPAEKEAATTRLGFLMQGIADRHKAVS